MTFWPSKTAPAAFHGRRERLRSQLATPALFVSGWSRPRNFAGNRYPFRAESHFLYFVGESLEGAALLIEPAGSTLYAQPPDPEAELWAGRAATFAELEARVGCEVKSIEDLRLPAEVATLPAQDAESAAWQSELCDRDIEHGSGVYLEGADRMLAEIVIEQRLIHDRAAIEQLRAAVSVTHAAHLAGMSVTRPGRREAEVRAAMEAAIVASGCVPAYGSIVTAHGEVLHNERHDGLLADGDLLLADVGAETPEGWAGDVTRVWPANGRFSSTQRELYEVVLASQLAAIAAVAPGVRYLDVHRAAGRKLLEGLLALGIVRGALDDLYARGAAALFFPHGVGHLLGLDVHDMEDLGDAAGYAPGRARSTSAGDRYLRLDRDLAPGMLVTIEPGFYCIPAILDNPSEVGELESVLDRKRLSAFADVRGIRIEDDVLVTDTGCEVLTRSIPKATSDVEAAMSPC
ncbi:MAG TPA: aminopeptidase P family protein [Polyangiaceae bacterium]